MADGSETLNPIDEKVAGNFTKERVGLVKIVITDLVFEVNVDETFHHLAAFQCREVSFMAPHVQARTYCKNQIHRRNITTKQKFTIEIRTIKKNTRLILISILSKPDWTIQFFYTRDFLNFIFKTL